MNKFIKDAVGSQVAITGPVGALCTATLLLTARAKSQWPAEAEILSNNEVCTLTSKGARIGGNIWERQPQNMEKSSSRFQIFKTADLL